MGEDLIAAPRDDHEGSKEGLILASGIRLPVARYRFSFQMRADLRLPEYAGSLLRGQFGAALRRVACMTGAPSCAPCPLYRSCPYPAIFETPAPSLHALQQFTEVPNPYVIEPPSGARERRTGEIFEFHLVLVGRALGQLPLIAYAFQRAFERGIGKVRVPGNLEDIAVETPDGFTSVWDRERASILPHETGITMPPLSQVNSVTLHISTPLRLQHQGHALPPDRLRPRTLITALLRRASLLFELHAGLPPVGAQATRLAATAERLSDDRRLRWRDWRRYSSRQQREMTLGGVIGEWTLTGELQELLPWLWLGQWLHVGKLATMGMGRYTLA